MFVPPKPELLAQVQAIYSAEFLAEVFQLLQVSDPAEQEQFKKMATLASAGYLQYLENNADHKAPHRQEKVLQKYKEALQVARMAYGEVLNDSPNV